jgi:hypothetical protein
MDKESQILNVALADYIPVASTEKLDRGGYVSFGEDNLFPQYLRDLAETSPIHGSLCISIGDMIAGSGLKAGSNQGRIEALDLYSVYYACAHDLKKFGGFYIEVIYSMDRKSIASLKHLPFEECRVAASNEEEEITGIFHSNDWSAPKKKKNKPEFIPIFNPIVNQDEPRQVYFCFNYTSGMIYPRPDYWSAVNYIELSKQIGIFHVNGISNGLFPSVVVSFFNGQLDPDAKIKIMREWENKLSGARNAGKFIMTFDEPGAQRPEITPLPLNDADKLYEYLTNTSRTEVLIAHRVTTPLLFGIRGDGQGFGNNKDELAIGLEIFTNHVIQPAQRKISGAITEIMQFEIPGIAIEVIPNTPLQTQAASVAAPAISSAPAQTQASPEAVPAEDTNVAATALNGAQIASMIEIIIQAASGILPISSAKAIMSASFPTLSSSQIDQIFNDIVPGSVNPDDAALKALHLSQKEKISNQDLRQDLFLAHALIEKGEDAPEDWVLIDSYPVNYDDDDAETEEIDAALEVHLAKTGVARPNAKSSQDDKIEGKKYYVRYRYRGEVDADSREFCKKMIGADKLYRKEDIMMMGKIAVNPGWGARGAATYSIWLYKGGGSCRHVWQKELYISAKGFGLDLSSPFIKQQAWSKANDAGLKIRNNRLVEMMPREMPYRGFLPDNPWFDYSGNPRKKES